MEVPLGSLVSFDVCTHGTNRALATADSAPAYAVYEESTDVAILSGTLTQRTGLTGRYRGGFTASTANGFEVGKCYSTIVTATVGGVGPAGVVAHTFRVKAPDSGVGAFEVSLTITYDEGLVPECDVIVTLTDGDPSSNVVARTRSNSSAVATVYLDEGTYYVWRQKSSIDFSGYNPRTLTVDEDGNATVS